MEKQTLGALGALEKQNEQPIDELVIPSVYYIHEDSKGNKTYVYDLEEMTKDFANKMNLLERENKVNLNLWDF